MPFKGNEGERMAEKYLRKKGFRILRRNFRIPTGEIDIIAMDGECIVFVEVKARADESFGRGFESVGRTKQRRIRDAALAYLGAIRNPAEMPAARFDVVSIHIGKGRQEIEHIVDAFGMDGGPAS